MNWRAEGFLCRYVDIPSTAPETAPVVRTAACMSAGRIRYDMACAKRDTSSSGFERDRVELCVYMYVCMR
jgi:hypothetical protein